MAELKPKRRVVAKTIEWANAMDDRLLQRDAIAAGLAAEWGIAPQRVHREATVSAYEDIVSIVWYYDE